MFRQKAGNTGRDDRGKHAEASPAAAFMFVHNLR